MRNARECTRDLLAQAQETLEESEKLLSLASPATIVNRAYYAAFYAGSALLMAREARPKSHQGVVDLLNREYVRAGRLERDLVEAYRRLYRLRLDSDYGPRGHVTPEAARDAVRIAREFVARAREAAGQERPEEHM